MGKQTDCFPLASVLCASEVIFLSHAPSPAPQKGATLCFRVSQWNPGQSHGADAGFCLPVATAVLRGSFRWSKWLIFHAFQLALPRGTAGLGCMPVLPRRHGIARPVIGAQPGCDPPRGRGTQRGRLCAGVSGARGLVCCRPAGSSPRRASVRATCSPSQVPCWTPPLSPPSVLFLRFWVQAVLDCACLGQGRLPASCGAGLWVPEDPGMQRAEGCSWSQRLAWSGGPRRPSRGGPSSLDV